MNKILKRLLTGVLTLATVFTALPTTAVHAAETQDWTESEERVGIVEKVMNDGSIGSSVPVYLQYWYLGICLSAYRHDDFLAGAIHHLRHVPAD